MGLSIQQVLMYGHDPAGEEMLLVKLADCELAILRGHTVLERFAADPQAATAAASAFLTIIRRIPPVPPQISRSAC